MDPETKDNGKQRAIEYDDETNDKGKQRAIAKDHEITTDPPPLRPENTRKRELLDITHEDYKAIRGTTNPTVMDKPFWIQQAGLAGVDSSTARVNLNCGKTYPLAAKGAVWCLTGRKGVTCTSVPYLREIWIGGVVDDKDYYIYNGKYSQSLFNLAWLTVVDR